MEDKILIFGHKNPDTDAICSTLVTEDLENKFGYNKVKACRLGELNKETKYVLDYFKVEAPELLEKVEEGQKVMLVDHNDFGQSVDEIEKAEILRVVDHHKIAGFQTTIPLYYMAMPVGSTATILSDMYITNNIEIEPKIAGLMLSAIISDTLLFKSPTCTEKDKEVALKLAEIAGVDAYKYGLDMLIAGTDLSDYTPEQIINIDSKPFTTNGVKYQVAQVNTASIEEVLKSKKELQKAMEDFMQENGVQLFVLLITDVVESNSQAIALGKTEIFEKAFNVKLSDDMVFLPGVVARKKQVVPIIDANI